MKHAKTALLVAATTFSSQAAIVSIGESTPVAVGQFSDGGSDFFGVVSGGTIGGASFSTSLTASDGSVVGRDHDDGSSRPELVTATWTLDLPVDALPGTGLTNINFDGRVAASQIWDNPSGDNDFIDFELLINGAAVQTLSYHPTIGVGGFDAPLSLDTNGDDVGDGITISTGGITFSLSDLGAGVLVTEAVLRGTYRTDSGSEEHVSSGTLTADYDQVPEPSTALLAGLAGLGLLRRRR